MTFIFNGNREFAASKIGAFIRHRATDIVQDSAAGIHGFASIQFVEKLNPLLRSVVAVNEIAEPVDACLHHMEVTLDVGVARVKKWRHKGTRQCRSFQTRSCVSA
jgi:hypothetical protein